MPNLTGTKWGGSTLGTSGGTVTWSIAGAGESLTRFGHTGRSVDGDTFIDFNFRAAIGRALNTWSKYGDIEFRHVADPGGAIGSNGASDIRIFFGRLPGNTLGQGAFPNSFDPIGGDIILDVRSEYNNDRPLFRGLVLHELGHALGLNHVSATTRSVMTPFLRLTTLQRDDRDGIRKIYGDPDVEPTLAIRGAGVYRMLAYNNDLVATGSNKRNIIIGSSRNDKADGGGGNDKLSGRAGNDDLRGGTGNDIMIGGAGADSLRGASGIDTADYRNSVASITFDFGVSNVGSGGHAQGDQLFNIERIVTGSGDDKLTGSSADERFAGLSGNDSLSGKGGNDRLGGGNGRDTLEGGDGNDWIAGGKGPDLLRGGMGDDTLIGQDGVDTLEGGDGNDWVAGVKGSDLLLGGMGDDTLIGQDGVDTLEGGDGNDLLYGGDMNDTLDGGAGDDVLRGQRSADTFVFADGHGNDRIVDFVTRSAAEFIDLSGVTALNDFADVTAASTNTAGGVLINTGGGDSILLTGVSLGQLGADDFLF